MTHYITRIFAATSLAAFCLVNGAERTNNTLTSLTVSAAELSTSVVTTFEECKNATTTQTETNTLQMAALFTLKRDNKSTQSKLQNCSLVTNTTEVGSLTLAMFSVDTNPKTPDSLTALLNDLHVTSAQLGTSIVTPYQQ